MRVLLIVDVPNWAWDRKADALIKHLKGFDIRKSYTWQYQAGYDAIHSFDWRRGSFIPAMTAGISSHNYELRHMEKAKKVLPTFSALTAVSHDLYGQIKKLNKKVYYTPNGVDHRVFFPKKMLSAKIFHVGWVGQPTEGAIAASGAKIDIHGYQHVLRPLKAALGEKSVHLITIERTWKTSLSHEVLCDFYNQCDCVIHPGFRAGTPNPIFEAAACGKAVICTKSGAAKEMIEENGNGFLVDRYDSEEECPRVIENFMDRILFLRDNRDVCTQMGKRSREIIESDWTWEQRAQQWAPVFRNHALT